MFEVYTGTRAGRPTVMIMLAAGSLVGALGLAWAQVRGSRALGEEVSIESTPLVVRPPAGWVQGRDHRGVFVKTIEIGYRGQQREAIERSIKFDYHRWEVFQPLPYLVGFRRYLDKKEVYEPVPASIGGFDGVQLRRRRMFDWRGRRELGETIYRMISTARGDEISIEYTPLGDVSSGDMELFDAVCRAVRLNDPGLHIKPDDALAGAGVRFPLADSWTIIGPDYPEVPGLYVQNNQGGIPVWGLGVFRTWLAPGRDPVDLLTSFAEMEWLPDETLEEPQQWARADGATVAKVTRGAMQPQRGYVVSAWVVSKSPAESVMIFGLANSQAMADVDQAAGELAEAIEFVSSYPPDGVEAVENAGRELAALIRRDGAAPWWGDEADTSYYYGEIVYGELGSVPLLVESRREPIGGDSAKGYKGDDRYVHRNAARDRRQVWAVDANADAYACRVEGDLNRAGQGGATMWEESREAGETSIHRRAPAESRSDVFSIPVGAAFVCPPVETLAQAWVAQQTEGMWLIEASRLRGSSTYTQLLIPLKPDREGQSRVLLVDDYWPRGAVITFDSDSEMVRQSAPVGYFERMNHQQAKTLMQALGRP